MRPSAICSGSPLAGANEVAAKTGGAAPVGLFDNSDFPRRRNALPNDQDRRGDIVESNAKAIAPPDESKPSWDHAFWRNDRVVERRPAQPFRHYRTWSDGSPSLCARLPAGTTSRGFKRLKTIARADPFADTGAWASGTRQSVHELRSACSPLDYAQRASRGCRRQFHARNAPFSEWLRPSKPKGILWRRGQRLAGRQAIPCFAASVSQPDICAVLKRTAWTRASLSVLGIRPLPNATPRLLSRAFSRH